MVTVHLVIPDTHSHPQHGLELYSRLGELVADVRPDHVVMMGDWADMPSLCSYDRGTKGFEGRRYRDDVAVAIESQEEFFAPIRARKKKLPTFHILEGNHENRIKKAISRDAAQLEGIIAFEDLRFKDFGWNITEYNGSSPGVLHLDGISYAHYFTSGVMGRPITGERPAHQLLVKQFQSCTQAHIHTVDYCVRTNATGTNIHGLVAGCLVDYYCDWAGEANNLWWKGVIIKHGVANGTYDPEFISLDRI